ncbi:hypothetical protein [Dickeya sp. CFBP 2040]|uniref:hypothetical protein n=1 Tax=Dickeya sp. CFBP 2040 TaxID=2718531 RepID=UPI001B2FFC7D|nr:hypothetical protein [Dickeya sp. CFBP 2040]
MLTRFEDSANSSSYMVYEFEVFRDIFSAWDSDRCYELLDTVLSVSDVLEQARACCGIEFPLIPQ